MPRAGGGASAAKVLPIDVPAFPLAELNRLTGNFGDRALVGEGSYGRVYRAKFASGELVAVKMFDNGSSSGQSEAEFCEQLSVVPRLKCDHFTQLLGYCLELNNRIVLYQFATMGSLYDILHGMLVLVATKQLAIIRSGFRIQNQSSISLVAGKKGVQGAEPGAVLTWSQRARIAYGAARGLEHLHEKARPPIVHRDVRSSNVLVFDGHDAKIGDFNLTNQSPDSAARLHSTKVLGTFGYHAPEYAMTGQLTQKSDVYSFGVVLLELLTGRKPVDHTMPKGQQSLVTWVGPDPPFYLP